MTFPQHFGDLQSSKQHFFLLHTTFILITIQLAMAQVVRPVALLTRHTARRLAFVYTPPTASATFPSLSSQCLRLQCRFYASKQKATKRLAQAPPKAAQGHAPAPTPARQRQTQSQAPATGATNYVEPMSLFIHTVAQRSSPTLLYLAPTSNAHPISCLGVAGFSIAYGGELSAGVIREMSC